MPDMADELDWPSSVAWLQDAENYWRRNKNEEGGGGYLAFSWDTAVWGVDMMLTQLTSPNNQVYQNEV